MGAKNSHQTLVKHSKQLYEADLKNKFAYVTNSAQFWRAVNRYHGNKNTESCISDSEWHSFFRNSYPNNIDYYFTFYGHFYPESDEDICLAELQLSIYRLNQ